MLKELFARDPQTKILQLDGWIALKALLPPKERRGVVLIDPPFEKPGELERLSRALRDGTQRFSTGIYLLWYPIKDRRETDGFAAALGKAIGREALRLELLVDDPADRTRLNGSGLLVINPPWTLAEEAETILPALAERLARSRYGAYLCAPLNT